LSGRKWSVTDREHLLKWREERDQEAGNALVVRFIPLVDYVVNRLSIGLPETVHKSDLKSLGLQGLLDAFEKFDPDRGLQFETYANFRIRGAIIDGLRQNDWVPRSVRDKARKIEEAFIQIEQENLRSAEDGEVSERLGMTVDELNQVLVSASLSAMISIDEPVYDDEEHQVDRYNLIMNNQADSPELHMNRQILKETLSEAIDRLPEKEKVVVSFVYFEDLNLTEIAHILNLSTSRISQLHSKAMLRLRAALHKEQLASNGT